MTIAITTRESIQRRIRRAAAISAVVSGSIVLGTLGMGYYVARKLTAPTRPLGPMDDYFMTPFETGADFEEVSFPPLTGKYLLHGWWLPRPESDRMVIACHGYRGDKSQLVGIGSILWRAGFNVLMFDFDGHGAAKGTGVTLGYHEVQDFFAALDYVEQRMPQARIGVIGYSMGAAVAIMGSARRSEVRCVLADSPFARHEDVVVHNVELTTHIAGKAITRLADQFLYYLGGYHGRDVEPMRDAALLAPRPLFIIHGTADTTIPVEQALLVYQAAGHPKELWLAEGAEHCGAYFQNRPLYCERAVDFFEQYLSAESSASEQQYEQYGSLRVLPSQESA